ncbi:MAG: TolC family protein [Gemmatimonadetes bacterium]|nr:TolC family protein [Gemmatimonadota bacterium]MCH8145462.1 TolC family protein [Gemmatimonadota bacterium]
MRTLKGASGLAEVAALAMMILAGPGTVVAQQARDTLALSQALEIARTTNPALQAVRLNADASAERIAPAGALPDPQLSFGLRNHSLDLGTGQMMAMNSVQLVQRFPWPGKLGFAEQQARSLAAAARWESEESEAALLARVKTMYYRLAFMDRALEVMANTRHLLREFHEVSLALYAVGTGLQQDVLQAQVAIARMTEDITVMSQNRVAMTARFNALLGRPATVEVGALQLPRPGSRLAPVDSLMGIAVEQRPALHAARARAEAAESGYRAARRAVYPDFAVTLGYSQRPQFEDLVTIMVGVSIPLWAGSRQMPLRREMAAVQAMEEAKELDLYNETFAQLGELAADVHRARTLAQMYTTSVLPQAQAAVESALSAYRVGAVDYMTLVQNELTVNRYEIERIRLTAEYHQALAQVEALVGVPLGGER